jgi:hypothetical protein
MFFLLLVQKKEPKKSTPAMMYSHGRPDSYRERGQVLLLSITTQNFLNILYWFEERRNTTDNQE